MTTLPVHYMRIPRAVRRQLFTPPADEHGTMRGYFSYACSCERCCAYGRDYRRSLERRQGRA